MPKTVYLSGPIRCVSDYDAFTWRATAEEYLVSKGFIVKVPKRKVTAAPSEIVEGDLDDIRESDIVLAHVPEGVTAIGTTMEVFFAAREGKIVILWGGDFNYGMSAWFYHHSEAYCDELTEALCFIWKNYSDKSRKL